MSNKTMVNPVAVFSNKPLDVDVFSFIHGYILISRWVLDARAGALEIDVYSCANPQADFDIDKVEDQTIYLVFQDKSSFKQAYQVARSLIRKVRGEKQ